MKTTADNKWAIITGASSGIGEALAFAFAAHGYNLFLTARNQEALEKVATNCRQQFGIEIQTRLADLSDMKAVDDLIEALSTENSSFQILVNNAGFGVIGDFVETDLTQELKMLDVQLAAMLKLTKALLPNMLARRDGKVLNVASVYSFAPVPSQAIYSACKAFVLSFSASLGEELRGTGVTVTALCPGITQTNFRRRAGLNEESRYAGVTAQAVARIAVKQTLKGKRLVVPGFLNSAFVSLARHLPVMIFPRFIKRINNARGVGK